MQKFAELYSGFSNLPQVGEDFRSEEIEPLFAIPWGHHKVIIDKHNENSKKALSFVNQVIQNNYPPNIDALIDNFDKALSHHDKKD